MISKGQLFFGIIIMMMIIIIEILKGVAFFDLVVVLGRAKPPKKVTLAGEHNILPLLPQGRCSPM